MSRGSKGWLGCFPHMGPKATEGTEGPTKGGEDAMEVGHAARAKMMG